MEVAHHDGDSIDAICRLRMDSSVAILGGYFVHVGVRDDGNDILATRGVDGFSG